MNSLILGLIIGFTLFYVLGVSKEHQIPKTGFNLIAQTTNSCYHLHHWLIMLILLIILTIFLKVTNGNFNNNAKFIFGFLIGAGLTDLRYSDAFQFKQSCGKN